MSPARLAELTALAARQVEDIRRELPGTVQAAAAECPAVLLTMEAWAAEQTEPVDEELLGLFTGMSRLEGPPSGPAEAPQILLFLDNLWTWAEEDREVFAEEVETTFLHELGHYLGLDEEEVADRGLA
jgi:predicted Zn-dependent protease with MMP-like domain